MFGMPLQTSSAREHLVGRGAIALDSNDTRSTRRERAGLVEGEQSRPREGFKRGGIADETTAPG
jgi:hypothetical protein